MGAKGFDIVLVRKSGPVEKMTIRSWFITGFVFIMLALLGGLGVTGYMLYTQKQTLQTLNKQTRRLAMRSDRLEGMLREQETRIILTQQAVKAINPRDMDAAPPPPKPAPPEAKPQSKPEHPSKPRQDAKLEEPEPPKPQAKPVEEPPKKPEGTLPAEPVQSEHVALRRVVQSMIGGHLVIGFDLVNLKQPENPVSGYAMVVVRGKRMSKPWIESWPPMKLTPLGRAVNFRRGTPFSAQRFRRLRARFVLGDKKLSRLEILIYNRQGEVMLVTNESINTEGQ